MRNRNSMANSRNASGSGTSRHHTGITVAEPVLRQVLRFLRDGAFAPEPSPR
jgi:hypothetical protein